MSLPTSPAVRLLESAIDAGTVPGGIIAHGRDPEPIARGRLSPGVRPERVAGQIAGCLASPWSRTVAVPRWTGLARLSEVPPVDRLLDLVLSRQAHRIRRVAARSVERRTG